MNGLCDPDFGDGKADKPVKAPAGPPPVRAWTIVFVANLPVPLFLGIWMSNATVVTGKVGMACGVALLYWLGLRACHRAPRATFWVIFGGWVVAASQIFPILQIYAGFAGLYIARLLALGMSLDYPVVQIIVFLVATLGTGATLIAIAAVSGLFGRIFMRP